MRNRIANSAVGAAALVVAALFGCSVPVDPAPRAPDVAFPERFSAQPEPPAAAAAADLPPVPPDWWTTLGDRRLDELVRRALAHNRDLRSSAARLSAAVARAEIRGAELWPRLRAELDATRSRQNFIGFPIPGRNGGVASTTFDRYASGLTVDWEIDLWGRVRAGRLAAHADVEAAAADHRAARLSIAAQTAKAWIALIEAEQLMRLADDTARSFERTAERVRARFEGGTRSPLDLRLALVDLANARALVERRRRQTDAARRNLQVLLGGYPDGAVDGATDLPTPAAAIPPGLPSALLRRRPDLVAAERRLLAADARLAESRADLYPRLSLTGSAGTASQELSDLVDTDFRVWSIGANLLAPLFEGGRLRAQVRLSDAEREAAIADYAGAVLDAFREVETALVNEQLLAQEQTHRTEESRQAAAAERLGRDRYDRGLDDIITLLSAQRSALNARSRLIELRRLRLDNRIDLLLALGGGYEPVQETSRP